MNLLELIANCKRQIQQIETSADLHQLPVSLRSNMTAQLTSAKATMNQAEVLLSDLLSTNGTAKLRLWERKLLDLSLRNNLLNMRMGKNALSLPATDICQMEDELSQGKELVLNQKEVKSLYRTMRTNLEETGANTLFITLGSLHWCERPGSRVYTAPILLLPVTLVPLKKDTYAVRLRDEEVMLNITLMEYLNQQFEIQVCGIDPLPTDAYGIDVSFVLHQLREAINGREGWEVVEEAFLGIFSFTKFVMWNDIHTHPSTVLSNDLVRSLVEGRLLLNATSNELDARTLDRDLRPDAMAIPVDADSSQLEALAASEGQQSFLLYGPPGTGKSQTITNLIANALYKGKRVLFVAQKKAALDVVHRRLQQIGLAPFCLELHSNKMDKHHFLQQLQEAIDAAESGKSAEAFVQTADRLYSLRLQLINFLEAFHAKQPCGFSLYECIERIHEFEAQPLQLPKDFMKGKTLEEIEELHQRIALLDAGETLLGCPAHLHPLHGFTPKPQLVAKVSTYISKYASSDSLEGILPQLPQIVNNVKQQVERNKSMSFMSRTPRQILEVDYKWNKFTNLAIVDEQLLDDIDLLAETVNRWANNIDKLAAWEKYANLFQQMKQSGLQDATERFLKGMPAHDIQRSFMAAVYTLTAKDIIESNPLFADYNDAQFKLLSSEYRTLKRQYQQLTRQELVHRLAANIPLTSRDATISAQLTLLRKRITSKGRGTSIRSLLSQIPDLLPSLCPVMLMSPLSVAQYIDMEAPKFDLVIFDEASQMPTGEAVGAIVRAKMAIIVGDPQQMPPTSFFTTNTTDEEDLELDDQESILDDCISLSMPARYLSWHYRSKHESLIAFSNQQYYKGRLITFPAADDHQGCLTWQHVAGYYDAGASRTNLAEAQAIVDETLLRLQQHPNRSLGIVAFSKAQSDLIEDLLTAALNEHPELERQNQESEEPLFVKNLENVQGDERDVILFSIGYGPDKEGKISMNFGPLNKVGGERRLNVAVSRSRYEMKVFSTLLPEQIDERRTQAQGVLDLKRFLKFAQASTQPQQTSDAIPHTSNTVKSIASALVQHGFEVKTNVGASAFKIDIAVVDARNPHRYKLGIICDGANHYQFKTVRDRLIVQPSMLQHLGWNILHVSTLDWHTNPERVTRMLLKELS